MWAAQQSVKQARQWDLSELLKHSTLREGSRRGGRKPQNLDWGDRVPLHTEVCGHAKIEKAANVGPLLMY